MNTQTNYNILDNIRETEEAEIVLRDLAKSDKIISFYEELGHDGYDMEGPESDLWDLHILTIKDGKHYYYQYHRENWYCGFLEEYELIFYDDVENIIDKGNYFHLDAVDKLLLKTIKNEPDLIKNEPVIN